jgi:hypothetical protein
LCERGEPRIELRSWHGPRTSCACQSGSRLELFLRANDVIHSFWVPSLAGKTDMVPGRVNRMVIQADRPGVYRGVCAEYCGLQHALMLFDVIGVPSLRDVSVMLDSTTMQSSSRRRCKIGLPLSARRRPASRRVRRGRTATSRASTCAGRAAARRNRLLAEGGANHHRRMAALQCRSPTRSPWLSIIDAGIVRARLVAWPSTLVEAPPTATLGLAPRLTLN